MWCEFNWKPARDRSEKERDIQKERHGWAEARFFLAALAGPITSLIFDNKLPLSITPSPITAEIYEWAWQTGEISTGIFQTQGDSSTSPFRSSLAVSSYSIVLRSIYFHSPDVQTQWTGENVLLYCHRNKEVHQMVRHRLLSSFKAHAVHYNYMHKACKSKNWLKCRIEKHHLSNRRWDVIPFDVSCLFSAW